MIDQASAAKTCAVVLDLPFPPGAGMVQAIIEAFTTAIDIEHCQRAVKHIIRSMTRCPMPADVYAAIEHTYEAKTEGDPWAHVKCRTCGDTGFIGILEARWCTCAAAQRVQREDPSFVEEFNRSTAVIGDKLRRRWPGTNVWRRA